MTNKLEISKNNKKTFLIPFGKYKNKSLFDIDSHYLQFLSDFSSDFIINDIELSDKSFSDLWSIIDKKDFFQKKLKEFHLNSFIIYNDQWWFDLDDLNNYNRMLTIYNKQNEFNLLFDFLKLKHINFTSIYLKLFHSDTINQTRIFLIDNHICHLCFKKINYFNDHFLYHDSCYNSFIKNK